MVTLTLANPLTAEQSDRLHAKGGSKDYRQGEKITLPRDDARLLINAGYAAGIDPADQEAVHKALDASTSAAKSGKASG